MNDLFLVDSVNIDIKNITDFTIKPAGLNYKPLTSHSHGALH